MDVKPSDRKYMHMGHSEEMNTNTHRAPLAVMEVLKVGTSLSSINSKFSIAFIVCNMPLTNVK